MAKKTNTNKTNTAQNVAQKHLDNLEETLAKQSSKMPSMTPGSKKAMVHLFPWLSAFFAFLSLIWANDLRDLISAINTVKSNTGSYLGFETYIGNTTELWIICIGYLLVAVLIGLAFIRGILKTLKRGWNYLFYGYSVAVVTGLLYFLLLSEYNSSRAFMTLLFGLGGLYILFQLREHHT